MLEQDFGHVVNISSICGVSGMPLRSTYCASKFALRGLTHTLRYEVLVVSTTPTLFKTKFGVRKFGVRPNA